MDRTPIRDRSGRRDDDVRAVSRTTKAVVAVAVLGVGAFAGLAASGQTSVASAIGGSTARDQGAAASESDGWWQEQAPSSDDGYYSDDDGGGQVTPSDQGFTPPQSAPSFSQSAPVGGSGGS